MQVLVTGACGFVMSVFIRQLLESDSNAEVIAVDLNKPDTLLSAYLRENDDRIDFHAVDVRDSKAMYSLMTVTKPDLVVHGATLTHVPEWERQDPLRFLGVNLMGTANVLDAARRTDSVHRIINVSSAAVYGSGTDLNEIPQVEDSALLPDEMYGISKASGEMVAKRFARLYDLEIPSVRFTKVFGPMERPSSSRTVMSLPYHLARAHVTSSPLTITRRTLDACGDWLSAVDIADALLRLSFANSVQSIAYNLASGQMIPVKEMFKSFGVDAVHAPEDLATIDIDPARRFGKDGTYSIERAARDFGWQPRSLSTQVSEYRNWFEVHETELIGSD